MKRTLLLVTLLVVMPLAGVRSQSEKPLDIYFIDVEGGQSTLFVSPGGESMLVDAGGGGADGPQTRRDPDRIAAVVRAAGLSQIDYLVTTHYHLDHVAGTPMLAKLVPIRTFVDHGDAHWQGDMDGVHELFEAYRTTRNAGTHLEVSPGSKIPLKGVDVQVITAADRLIRSPLSLPGAGAPNPLCSEYVPLADNPMIARSTENAASTGFILRYGGFSMLDGGDLVKSQERDLVCPKNLIGHVDVFLTPSHGVNISGSKLFVHALQPRVVVWNNGPAKGSRETFDAVKSSPRLQQVWQLHYLMPHPPSARLGETVPAGGDANNEPDEFIANLEGKGRAAATMAAPIHDGLAANYIKIAVRKDGSFTVTNSRTGASRPYSPAR